MTTILHCLVSHCQVATSSWAAASKTGTHPIPVLHTSNSMWHPVMSSIPGTAIPELATSLLRVMWVRISYGVQQLKNDNAKLATFCLLWVQTPRTSPKRSATLLGGTFYQGTMDPHRIPCTTWCQTRHFRGHSWYICQSMVYLQENNAVFECVLHEFDSSLYSWTLKLVCYALQENPHTQQCKLWANPILLLWCYVLIWLLPT